MNCIVAEGFLKSMGHEVYTAMNGRDAELAFQEQRFDIALLDINLPDCDGRDLLSKLREFENLKSGVKPTPMIAVSAHVYNEEVASYLAAGFDGYLPKPLDKDALCYLVQTQLEGEALILEQHGKQEADHVNSQQRLVIAPAVVEGDMAVLGKEKMLEIAGMFEQGADEIIQQLKAAEVNQDQREIKQLAHKLKGSAGSLGMHALFDLCLSIEKSPQPMAVYQQQSEELIILVGSSKQALLKVLS